MYYGLGGIEYKEIYTVNSTCQKTSFWDKNCVSQNCTVNLFVHLNVKIIHLKRILIYAYVIK